jgi:radical SAM enzyme (rSAM/lipoprotein system)
MPADIFLQQAKIISKKMNPKLITVVITGGEPLIRKDIEFVGEELRKLGFRWSIVTNGMAYTAERHKKLLSAGMGALTLSIDGIDEDHNWLRQNPNSFNKVTEALYLLSQTPRVNFDVVTCVNPHNINKLETLYTFLLSKGLKNWRLFTIAPKGRAANNESLQLSAEQMKRLMLFIKQKRLEDKMHVNFSCEAYVGTYETEVRDGFFFCRAGIQIASILCDGSINACPNIDRGFSQGNIYENNFPEIWNNNFQIMRDRSWTKKEKCATCKEYKWCKGSGFHLWNAEDKKLLQCHYASLRN